MHSKNYHTTETAWPLDSLDCKFGLCKAHMIWFASTYADTFLHVHFLTGSGLSYWRSVQCQSSHPLIWEAAIMMLMTTAEVQRQQWTGPGYRRTLSLQWLVRGWCQLQTHFLLVGHLAWVPERQGSTLALAAMGLEGGGSYCEVICKRVIRKRKDSGAQRCLCHLIQAHHS